MLTARYPVNTAEHRAFIAEVEDKAAAVAFSTIGPAANNSERSKQGQEQHATPSWNRLTCGDRQAGKIRGHNSTKTKRREAIKQD